MANTTQNCNCQAPIPPHGYTTCWCPPPPMPPGYPAPMPVVPAVPEEPVIPSKSREEQLCLLSKRSAAINAMIKDFKTKNKDVLVRIGSTSYNFGPYYSDVEDEEVSLYGDEFLDILETELSLIKAKILEIAALIDTEETTTTTSGSALTTVTQGN